jgi:hypothetical protein
MQFNTNPNKEPVMSKAIYTQYGYVDYARFCGSRCEAWAYGADPVKWDTARLGTICEALRADGVSFKLV